MSGHPQILQVVENDLCIACGACIAACPVGVVIPSYSAKRGAHEVALSSSAACTGCPAPCDSVCPSVAINFARMQGVDRCPREGFIERTLLAHVERHRDNGISSSGGIVRAFIESFLEAGRPVVCLARAEGGGYEPALLTRPDELERLPGSIYHGVSFVKALPLIRQAAQPCLLVSTSCQLEGIEKFAQNLDASVKQKIALKLGLICGWMYTDHALAAFMSYSAVAGRLIDAQYRGEDQVGRLKLVTDQGRFAFNRRVFDGFSAELNYRASFTSAMNRLRCRTCQDHVNVLADVAVGDAWLSRSPGVKRSIVVLRNATGLAAFERLRESIDIVVEPAQAGDLVESQSANLVEGTEARELATFLEQHGTSAPACSFIADRDDENSAVSPSRQRQFAKESRSRRLIRDGNYLEHRRVYARGLRRRVAIGRVRSIVARLLRSISRVGP